MCQKKIEWLERAGYLLQEDFRRESAFASIGAIWINNEVVDNILLLALQVFYDRLSN